MRVRRLLVNIVPPILVDGYRALRDRRHLGPIWKGVYPHFRDVATFGPGFDGDRWVTRSYALAKILTQWFRQKPAIPHWVRGRHMLLPFLVASFRPERRGVTVLDVGGGMGIDYLHLRSSIRAGADVEYHIVESARICEGGSRLFAEDPRVHFHVSLPQGVDRVDIAYVNNTLQFVEDYAGLLRALCAYRPQYLLLVNLTAGDIPTYATAQRNVKGSVIAAWFFNVDEIIKLMVEEGYRLSFKAASDEEWRQDNFPAAYRLGRPCHLLFSRN